MSEMYRATLQAPEKWRAGYIGDPETDPDAKPFFFDCAGCGAKEPEIAGYLTSDPEGKDFGRMRLIMDGPGSPCLALYCRECWAAPELPHREEFPRKPRPAFEVVYDSRDGGPEGIRA